MTPLVMKTNYNATTVQHATICHEELSASMEQDDNYNSNNNNIINNNVRIALILGRSAIKVGNLPALVYLQSVNCINRDAICNCAALYQQLHILQWARRPEQNFPWNASVCAHAATNGDLSMLMWAHNHGCPWDKTD
jgi:hypothetical protein